MGIHKEAAEVILKRQTKIYGAEKAMTVAGLSGYKIDPSGHIISVSNEERAFNSLVENAKKHLGPLAAVSCRTALMGCSSRDTDMTLRKISDESVGIVSSLNNLRNALSTLRIPEKSGPCYVVKEKTAYPATGFFQRVLSFIL